MRRYAGIASSATLLASFALVILHCSSAPDADDDPIDPGPSEGVIGPDGGTVSHAGGASVVVPPGALSEDTTITVTPLTEDTRGALAPGLVVYYGGADFGPDGTTFDAPVTITFPLDEPMTAGAEVRLFIYDSEQEAAVESEFVGIVADDGLSITAEVTHFTTIVVVMPVEARLLAEVESYIGDGADIDVALTNYTSWIIDALDPFDFWANLHGCCYTFVGVTVDLLYFRDGEEFADVRPVGEETTLEQRLTYGSEYHHGDHHVAYEVTVHLFIGVEPTLTLSAEDTSLEEGETTTVTAELSCNGEPMVGNALTLEVDSRGALSSSGGDTDARGQVQVTFEALEEGASEVSVGHRATECLGDEASFGANEVIQIGASDEWTGTIEFVHHWEKVIIEDAHYSVEFDFTVVGDADDPVRPISGTATASQTLTLVPNPEAATPWTYRNLQAPTTLSLVITGEVGMDAGSGSRLFDIELARPDGTPFFLYEECDAGGQCVDPHPWDFLSMMYIAGPDVVLEEGSLSDTTTYGDDYYHSYDITLERGTSPHR